jgi:hypothetical protein
VSKFRLHRIFPLRYLEHRHDLSLFFMKEMSTPMNKYFLIIFLLMPSLIYFLFSDEINRLFLKTVNHRNHGWGCCGKMRRLWHYDSIFSM